MLRLEREAGALTLVSRLARPRSLAVIAVVLLALAALVRARVPGAALALATSKPNA